MVLLRKAISMQVRTHYVECIKPSTWSWLILPATQITELDSFSVSTSNQKADFGSPFQSMSFPSFDTVRLCAGGSMNREG